MGRAPCCDKTNVKRGPWSPDEDATLKNYLHKFGTGGNWIALPRKAGLRRCGKSCRLRWLNYLRPDIKHGGFTEEEDNIIFTLYTKLGSRWSVIASHLQGRTDNDVKNHWNTKLKKKLMASNPNSTTLHGSTPSMPLVQSAEAYGTNIPYFPPLLNQTTSPMSLSSITTEFTHQCLINDPTHDHYPLPQLTDHQVSGFSTPALLSQDSTSILDNNYVSWTGYSSSGDVGFSVDLGTNWSQETIGDEFGKSYPNLAFNTYYDPDTKPQGLYQSVTNQY